MQSPVAIVIDAPIETVFAFVSDSRKQCLWKDGLIETRFLDASEAAPARGARFSLTIREGGRINQYAGEIVAFERPQHFGERIGNAAFQFDTHYELVARAPRRTELHCTCTFTAKTWPMRVFELCFGWFNRAILKKQLNRLKELAEST